MKNGGFLEANVIKAQMIQENGGTYGKKSSRAHRYWNKDPLTVNMGGDWDPHSKEPLGLKKNLSNSMPNGDLRLNIRAGIRILARKGFHPAARPAKDYPKFHIFDGWLKALQRYGPKRQMNFYNQHIWRRANNPGIRVTIGSGG